jgi:thiamine-phosphate pyrophosphorylase
VRHKERASAGFLALVEAVVETARRFDARVIVNDRADIARMAGADGVHVGQEDLSVDAVRLVVGRAATVGVSTHDREQIEAALGTTASYVAVGPIFGTSTKDTGYEARGLDLIRFAAHRGKPVVGIGGITLERAPSVVAAGASAVAVIGDLLAGKDPVARVRAFVAALPARPFNV